jgi:hypothetical protein
VLRAFFESVSRGLPGDVAPDVLDKDIRSGQTLTAAQEASSASSRRWALITTIQPEDFLEALEATNAG